MEWDGFFNREEEQRLLLQHMRTGGFGYVTGRRRVGKTELLKNFCAKQGGVYHQAVEGASPQQIFHLVQEWKVHFPFLGEMTPKSWPEFFAILERESWPSLMVIDEFPYLVQSDSTLPSHLQKFVDHVLPQKKSLLLVSGSSQNMLFSTFLEHEAPLYGRALLHLDLKPLSYKWFCEVFKIDPSDPESFESYSLVGGIPHYWRLMPKTSVVKQATELYFSSWASLAEEPQRILSDEGVRGSLPKSILDLVGSGVNKPSEMAARLGISQSQLPRVFEQLMKMKLLSRQMPFGESTRTSKRVFYSIDDFPLAFYYAVVLPNRHLWEAFSLKEKKLRIHEHASHCWEVFCRSRFAGASRYWEKGLEIDLVARQKDGSHLVAECKWRFLVESEKKKLLSGLKEKFQTSLLARQINNPRFRIFSQENLGEFSEVP